MAKVVKAPKAAGGKKKGAKYKMPDRIPEGEKLSDKLKGEWIVGKPIGVGGFGEIYSATKVGGKGDFAVKIEPKENGPLFVEMHFFMRVCQEKDINQWMQSKKLKFLGLPRYISTGTHDCKGNQFRFVVMERFGKSLQNVLNDNHDIISHSAVFKIAHYVLDTLEYIHEKGYVHADVKASNLLFGYNKAAEDKVYLVDFGLVSKYPAEYKSDARCAHNGTIEFTSRDAHVGATTRRGDMEILAYNMLRWCTGKLPWEDKLKNCQYVQQEKIKFMEDVNNLLQTCFEKQPIPAALSKFFTYVAKMDPLDVPDYNLCRSIFKEGLKASGGSLEGKFVFKSISKNVTEVGEPEVKKAKTPIKKPSAKKENGTPKRGKAATSKEVVEPEKTETNREPRKRAVKGRSQMANGFAGDTHHESISNSEEEDKDSEDYSTKKPTQRKAAKRRSGDKKVLAGKKKKTAV